MNPLKAGRPLSRKSLATLLALASASALTLAACQHDAPPAPTVAAAAPVPAPTTPAAAPIASPAPAPSPTPAAAPSPVVNAKAEALYQEKCASCHDNPEATRSPARSAIRAMSFQYVNFTLTNGKMKEMGKGLSDDDRGMLAGYLTGRSRAPSADWTQASMCAADKRTVDLKGQVVSAHFGFDRNNTRTLTAKQAGLTTKDLSNMELAWSIGFPETAEMRAQGSIVGTTLFFPVASTGQMYAIDLAAAKPCLKWVFSTPGGVPLRNQAAYGVLADGSPLLVVAGVDSTWHAVDPRDGKKLWSKAVGSFSYSFPTGVATILKDRVIIPMSQFEISVAANNNIPCCNNHGYVLSLDPKTGAQQWRYDTMEDAKPLRDRGDGKMYYGPSGAPIWNSPVVDEKRGLIYFGTGEANSEPTHKNTDALIAINLKDGKEKWSFQATGRDIYLSGCGLNPQPTRFNCSNDTVYRDVDFGASVILGTLKNGKQILYAGQKSGAAWALDPDTGKVLWVTEIGTGTALGGIHWGMAFTNDTLYVPIANIGRQLPGGPPIDPALKAGLYALDAATGKIKWMYSPDPPAGAAPPPPPADGRPPRPPRNAAFSTAIAVVDGAVIAGALDGTLYSVDAKTGKLLWSYQTAQPYQTINGVPGKGGSIDANAITAGNGLLLVTSGYAQFGEIPGNVLLAFKPKAK